MRVVLWIGSQPNQTALAHKIHTMYPLAGIVVETRIGKSEITLDKIIERLILSKIGDAWTYMLGQYSRQYPSYPDTKLLHVGNINSEEAYEFSKELAPDLIIVSGTRLVRNKMLSIQPSIGILNLHTGLSPYVKGGPNCTNWCLANDEPHLIGNTIMWIDAGVDTGNIITTETTAFTGGETLRDVHMKVMEHGHSLYLKAIQTLASGIRPSVDQRTITEGKTYKNKQWGLKEKFALLKNFGSFGKDVRSAEYKQKQAELVTVKI